MAGALRYGLQEGLKAGLRDEAKDAAKGAVGGLLPQAGGAEVDEDDVKAMAKKVGGKAALAYQLKGGEAALEAGVKGLQGELKSVEGKKAKKKTGKDGDLKADTGAGVAAAVASNAASQAGVTYVATAAAAGTYAATGATVLTAGGTMAAAVTATGPAAVVAGASLAAEEGIKALGGGKAAQKTGGFLTSGGTGAGVGLAVAGPAGAAIGGAAGAIGYGVKEGSLAIYNAGKAVRGGCVIENKTDKKIEVKSYDADDRVQLGFASRVTLQIEPGKSAEVTGVSGFMARQAKEFYVHIKYVGGDGWITKGWGLEVYNGHTYVFNGANALHPSAPASMP